MDPFLGVSFPHVIEAMGFLLALMKALEWNFSKIIVEGDAKQVIQSINRDKDYVSCDSGLVSQKC